MARHFVEICVALVCVVLLAVSIGLRSFGVPTVIGIVGLAFLARALLVRRAA